ncbi:MAG: ABC transporter ATP-binding protein [Spirochaetaceae bacterium]|nr:MAG: ABC transporter ATP-binding protein [Spirochaetaceae bacterium]
MLAVRNLESGYGHLRVLKGVSLHVSDNEIVTVIGPNGAGKSTLLLTLAGIIKSSSGTIAFLGAEIQAYPSEKRVASGMALVPEGRRVFSTLTVRENLELGAFLVTGKQKKAVIDSSIDRMYGLFPKLQERQKQLAGTLSGGEQQMLAIARALMSGPRLLMMDEPSMGIAPIIVSQIFATIQKLKADGMSILLVEQNARRALSVADRGYVLETGQIVVEGSRDELAANHDVARAYLGKDYSAINE